VELAKLVASALAEVVKALAWPATLLFILSRYKAPLAKLIDRIASESTQVSIFGAGAHFDRQSVGERERIQAQDIAAALPDPYLLDDEEPATTETPADRPSNSEAVGIVRNLRSQLRVQRLAAQEQILREFERRWDVTLRREAIVATAGQRLPYDAVAIVNEEVRLIEIRYTAGAAVQQWILEKEREKLLQVQREVGQKVRLYLCIVSTFDGPSNDASILSAQGFFDGTSLPVSVEGFTVNPFLGDVTPDSSAPDR
jgi:hypothetical protein